MFDSKSNPEQGDKKGVIPSAASVSESISEINIQHDTSLANYIISGNPGAEIAKLLDTQIYGIGYRTILAHFSKGDSNIEDCSYKNNPLLTQQLLGLSKQLSNEFIAIKSSETLYQKLVSCIPFFGPKLKSDQYLEDHNGLNLAVEKLEDAGLIQADTRYYRAATSPYRYGMSMPSGLFMTTLKLTELGSALMSLK